MPASIALTTVQQYLKQVLAPNIESQYAKETPFLANIKKNSGVEMQSDKFILTVVKSMHSGVAAVGRGETLPTGSAAATRVEMASKYLFVGFSAEDQDLEMARKDSQALANLMTLNETQMREALAKQLNRMFLANGDGAVATTNGSASNSTALVVDAASSPNGDIEGTKYITPGAYIKIGTGNAVQVASVNSASSVTLAAARSWADGDKVYIVGPDGSTGMEPDGLKSAIGTSNNTFQTINRSTNPWWIAHILSSANTYDQDRELEKKINLQVLKAKPYGKTSAIFMNVSAYNRILADLQSIQRSVNTVELKGGFKGLAYITPQTEAAIVYDDDVPDGEIYGVDFSAFTRVQLADLQWLELDGSGNVLRLQGKATWEGFLKNYVNLGLKKAKANWSILNGTFTV